MQEVDAILEKYPEKKVIYFADDNFAHDVGRLEAICKAIIERRLPTYFWCQARADTLAKRPDVVELMGKAQFAAVLLGIETPVPRLLKEARKGTSTAQIEQTVEMLHRHDVGVWGTFVLGLPGETAAETQLTVDYIAKIKVDVAQITVATPIPGSTLYDDTKAAGKLRTRDWDQYDFTSPVMTDQLDKPAMDAIMRKAYLKVYLSGRFWKSLFTQKTNLDRLRRTAFGTFGTFIRFLIRERIGRLFGFRHKQKRHDFDPKPLKPAPAE
jgi:radical SAM superfamily enzyme YgiQ (UPF0313 family)